MTSIVEFSSDGNVYGMLEIIRDLNPRPNRRGGARDHLAKFLPVWGPVNVTTVWDSVECSCEHMEIVDAVRVGDARRSSDAAAAHVQLLLDDVLTNSPAEPSASLVTAYG